MNNPLYKQEHLAEFAPQQSLEKYRQGADPRVINEIMALSEMKEQAATRQRANLANGAAQGQMPTVRDKIMQLFQQANQPRQQPQQQPNPMAQGIMSQARPPMQTAPMPQEAPQEVPQEAKMYHGGVARLPVNDRMFGYANGGIIAFRTGERPEDKEGYTGDDEKLTPEQVREILDRITAEGGTPPTPAPQRATGSDVPPASRLPSMGSNIPKALSSGVGNVAQRDPQAYGGERESEVMRAAKAPFRALGEGIKGLYKSAPGTTPSPVGAADQDLSAAIANVDRTAPTAAPTSAPRSPADAAEQARLDKLYKAQTSGIAGGQKRVGGYTLSETIETARQRLEQEGKKLTPDDVRTIQRRFEGAIADQGTGAPTRVVPPAANAAPPSAGPGGPMPPIKPPAPATGTGIDQLLQQQQARLTAQANAPKMPEPDMVEGGLKYLAAQDKYVRETGDSEAAKRLYKVYDEMAKRARADDDAQAAQRAEDARNNLWSFLSNTRGSSLATAAGKADAALQPLLAEQKKTNAEYRKYSYERDMNRNKADAEARMAEEARKRGEFAKAIEHEQKERTYRLESRKADQQAEHFRNTEMNQALQTQATLQASREGNITQLEVAKINRAAQMAGFNKPSESERVRAEYQRILQEKGQKAADAFLADEQKIRAVVGGVRYEGQDKDQTRAYYQSLYQDPNYGPQEDKIRRLEAKPKRTEKDERELAAARAYVKRKQEEVRRDFGMAGGAGDTGGAPQRVTTPEEYAKLPPNTRFIAPDGSIRVKP